MLCKRDERKESQRLPKDAPNIVLFMTDDVGFSNPEVFGGPAHMPALLTGHNHPRVGYGTVAEFAADWDGYVGVIPRSAATVAQILGSYGYATAAFGKWHNTPIDFLRQHRALHLERPFFLWFTSGAVYGPSHVQNKWADKYKGKFDP